MTTDTDALPDDYILLVEDTIEVGQLEALYLRRVGFEVHHVTHLKHARAIIAEKMPILIILDLILPDGNGWSLIDDLRAAYSENILPPIIIATAYSDSANRVIAKIYDVADYLIQPVRPDEFLESVQNVLNEYR